MKRMILIFLVFSCMVVYAQDTTNVNNMDTTTSQSSSELKNEIINFSHFLNHTNDMITTLTVVISLLSLFAAVVGFISWRFIPRLTSQIKRVNESVKKMEKQNGYLNKSQGCLYQTFSDLIANPNDKTRLLMRIQEAKLFSFNKQERESALLYFYANGTIDNVDNIEFLSKNDDSSGVRDLAKTVLAIINYKKKG